VGNSLDLKTQTLGWFRHRVLQCRRRMHVSKPSFRSGRLLSMWQQVISSHHYLGLPWTSCRQQRFYSLSVVTPGGRHQTRRETTPSHSLQQTTALLQWRLLTRLHAAGLPCTARVWPTWI